MSQIKEKFRVLAQTEYKNMAYGLTDFRLHFREPSGEEFEEGWRSLSCRGRIVLAPMGGEMSPPLHFLYHSMPDRYPVTKIAIYHPLDRQLFGDGEWMDCVGLPEPIRMAPFFHMNNRHVEVPVRRDNSFECRFSKSFRARPIRSLAILAVRAPALQSSPEPWDDNFWRPWTVIPYDLNFSEDQQVHMFLAYSDSWVSTGG